MKKFYLEKSIGIDFQKEMFAIVLIGKTLRSMELLDYQIWHNGLKESEELEKQFIENLSIFIKRNKLSNIRGAFCFSRQDIILKYIDIPAPKKEDIKSILEYEIERHIPLNKDDVYYDFQVIKQRENNLYNILVAVSRKSQVNHYIELLKEASVIPAIVSLSTASNFNLLSFNNYNEKIFNAVIEIGLRSTSISFILDASVIYSRSISIPLSENWLKSLIENTDSYIELETTSEVFTEFLLKEINLSIASCREILSDQTVDCFYLSGGGSLAEPIKNHLEQKVAGTVQILNPLAKLHNKGIPENDRNFLANAVGAGIQNHIKKNFYINFIPESLRKYVQDNSLRAMMILSGILIFVSLTAAFSSILKENLVLSEIENQLKDIKKEVIIAENLEREYERLRHQKLILQEIQTNNPSRLRILKELTTLLPLNVWLPNVIIKQDAVEITGTADSTSKLIPLLEKSDFFTDVHFIDSIRHIKNREQFKIRLPLKKQK